MKFKNEHIVIAGLALVISSTGLFLSLFYITNNAGKDSLSSLEKSHQLATPWLDPSVPITQTVTRPYYVGSIVKLAWNPSPDAGVTGYRIYQTSPHFTSNGVIDAEMKRVVYDAMPSPCCEATIPVAPGPNKYYATAIAARPGGELESLPSNTVEIDGAVSWVPDTSTGYNGLLFHVTVEANYSNVFTGLKVQSSTDLSTWADMSPQPVPTITTVATYPLNNLISIDYAIPIAPQSGPQRYYRLVSKWSN